MGRDALAIELQSHADLVYSTFDFPLENESDEEVFDLLDLDIQLLV